MIQILVPADLQILAHFRLVKYVLYFTPLLNELELKLKGAQV